MFALLLRVMLCLALLFNGAAHAGLPAGPIAPAADIAGTGAGDMTPCHDAPADAAQASTPAPDPRGPGERAAPGCDTGTCGCACTQALAMPSLPAAGLDRAAPGTAVRAPDQPTRPAPDIGSTLRPPIRVAFAAA